jgi:hypothetical protein
VAASANSAGVTIKREFVPRNASPRTQAFDRSFQTGDRLSRTP